MVTNATGALKNKDELYSTRQLKRGRLMVWLAIGFGGRTNLVFLNGRQKNTDYIEVLNSELLLYAFELEGEE